MLILALQAVCAGARIVKLQIFTPLFHRNPLARTQAMTVIVGGKVKTRQRINTQTGHIISAMIPAANASCSKTFSGSLRSTSRKDSTSPARLRAA